MRNLINKLTQLADELDAKGATKTADLVDKLIKKASSMTNVEFLEELIEEVSNRAEQEEADIETNLTICPACGGEGYDDEYEDEIFCPTCKGAQFIAL